MACLVVRMLDHIASLVTEVRRTRQYDVTAMTSELHGLVSGTIYTSNMQPTSAVRTSLEKSFQQTR